MTSMRRLVPKQWVAPLLALVVVLLAAWTLTLGYRLPARHTTHHWDVAWVGFDIALAGAFAATGLSVARRSSWAQFAAAVAATLLVCDAWFDNVLANGLEERVEAAVEAVAVELPLAILCVWVARNSERTGAAVRSVRSGTSGADLIDGHVDARSGGDARR
jgi:uncharacterized membrane protein